MATRRERRQEGLCCAESCSRMPSTWLPRLSTSTAGEATKKFENGDKTRTATRRLVLCRELLKDAIYMATKAVDKYSRRGYKEVRERRQDENGDKKVRAAQRAAQGCQESWPLLKRRILNLFKKQAFFKATNKMKRSNFLLC